MTDNLSSVDTVEVAVSLGEEPSKGLWTGSPRSVEVNDTSFMAAAGNVTDLSTYGLTNVGN